jgi:hypothetical protein
MRRLPPFSALRVFEAAARTGGYVRVRAKNLCFISTHYTGRTLAAALLVFVGEPQGRRSRPFHPGIQVYNTLRFLGCCVGWDILPMTHERAPATSAPPAPVEQREKASDRSHAPDSLSPTLGSPLVSLGVADRWGRPIGASQMGMPIRLRPAPD